MSRFAAERMVHTSCVWRVGSLPCHGAGLGNGCIYNQKSIGLNTREDAAVGLCMHLVGAQLVECGCFHSGRVGVNLHDGRYGVLAWAVSAQLRGLLTRNGTFRADVPREGIMKRVHGVFRDDVPAGQETPGMTYLCLHPIALHAIHVPKTEFLPLWQMLTARDAEHTSRLEEWRRNASVSSAARAAGRREIR